MRPVEPVGDGMSQSHMTDSTLDNIVWAALTGTHETLSAGNATTRRYDRGYTPLFGSADPQRHDFAGLAVHWAPGELLACSGWTGPIPDEIHLEHEFEANLMVWTGIVPAPDPELAPVRLGIEHFPQMSALVEMTRPGPFAERTVLMGEFHGVFDGDKLIAMAGERLCAHPWREVSGICTDPAYQGRGLARRMTAFAVRRQMLRGERPFLHVMRSNEAARGLYLKMGFVVAREVVIRALVKMGG